MSVQLADTSAQLMAEVHQNLCCWRRVKSSDEKREHDALREALARKQEEVSWAYRAFDFWEPFPQPWTLGVTFLLPGRRFGGCRRRSRSTPSKPMWSRRPSPTGRRCESSRYTEAS